MTTSWIVVASASEARIFENTGPNKGLALVHQLDHPESRERAADLVADRPGHHAFVPHADPHQTEKESFALELARLLDTGRNDHRYQRLILAANPAFLGQLNQHLNSHVAALVSDTVAKDYTKTPVRELPRLLESCLCV